MRILKTALAAVAVVGAVLATGTPAGAQSTAPSERSVEQQVQGLLQYNKGAKRVGTDTVQLAPGVSVTVADASRAVPADWFNCDRGWLCLWEDSNMNGARINFTDCRRENLGSYRTDKGYTWNDRVTSYSNNQSGNVQSKFYDNGTHVLTEGATGYRRNLSYDKDINGNHLNDRIDAVQVC
ncbi:peptidase inhibitor family I36 protein [Streptomyces sp. NPDC090077]|uniref:peptidase inhibitor family I36 protein n=1 Tax=Streptomyces sp. NPDC090077 TaxID=3365938 RepID=UPI003807C208